jgi:hypothetical protein
MLIYAKLVRAFGWPISYSFHLGIGLLVSRILTLHSEGEVAWLAVLDADLFADRQWFDATYCFMIDSLAESLLLSGRTANRKRP